MSTLPKKGRFPDYENPPVVETILGVQFHPLTGWRNAHLGAFWKTLSADEWPNVFDVPPLVPQFEQFTEQARWATVGAQLKITQDPSARLQIKNKDGNRMIQLQNSRLHFNWLGQAGGRYPRYESVRDGFVWTLQRFIDFVAQEKVGTFRPNQWEVTYLNHIPRGTVWNTPNDWGFFLPLGAVPTVEHLVRGESFQGGWHFVIPEQRGRLHVQWTHGRKAGPEEEQELIVLDFTARGEVSEIGSPTDAILNGIDLGRETIVKSFEIFASKAANEHWGLKDANH
jgi:uncharacterized protein (TIGR04255 family)